MAAGSRAAMALSSQAPRAANEGSMAGSVLRAVKGEELPMPPAPLGASLPQNQPGRAPLSSPRGRAG